MRRIVFDLEADGLIEECTKIHCLCYYDIIDSTSVSLTDYDDMRELFLDENLTAICHNCIRFDKVVLEKILGIEVKAFLIDSLALSWYLFPNRDRGAHNLNAWGIDLGIAKPVIEDWSNQTLEEYIHRCEEDVKINTKLWEAQISYLNELYEGDPNKLIKYLMFKMDCAREQEEVRWKLDVEKCKSNLTELEAEKDHKYEVLSNLMPRKDRFRKMSKPKKPYKKDGSYSSIGERWFQLLEERELPEDWEEDIEINIGNERGNPNSPDQLKSWLHSLGWEPQTFKYIKENDGSLRRVEQISLPQGQGLCESVKDLFDDNPGLENLDKYSIISHRIGVLKGFLRDVSEDGYLKAQIMGLTNTLRFQHTELVNLPGVAKHYGEYIRGVLIAPENHLLCGSDMSSLEDRTKQHYMYFFDPEYVQSMIKPGFDPHLDLAMFAYELTNGEMGVPEEDAEFYKSFDSIENLTDEQKARYKSIKKERHAFKTVNYAAVYGSGAPTMSRNSGMSVEKCEKLLLAYWQKNWSVKKVANSCKVKTVYGQMWLFQPVSRLWYSLRFEKDKFSTLNQGTGVYCFDTWVRECRKRGVKMCGQFHDIVLSWLNFVNCWKVQKIVNTTIAW